MGELVLVTGGSGYVAGWCIAELLNRGYQVRTTVRSPGSEQAVRDAVRTTVAPEGRLGFATADLTEDGGWAAAVAGVDYVLHVASPLGNAGSDDPDGLIGPVRDGALRVLRAATAAGVKRVVLTSAANAASPSSYAEDGVTDETLWTDPADPTLIPYRRSKTLAERAAWDFMAVLAMTTPAAAGQRFLATGEFTWMRDMARVLRAGLGPHGEQVSTRQIPDFIVRLVARYRDPSLREITPAIGRRNRHSTEKPGVYLVGSRVRPHTPCSTARTV